MSDMPERIWTASTEGKCHVGFATPSMNYTNEYIRADLMAELVEALRGLLGLLDAGSLYEPQAYRARAALAKIKEPQHG